MINKGSDDIYYKNGDIKNAEFVHLAFTKANKIPKNIDDQIARSLALGYTPVSIILYEVLAVIITQSRSKERDNVSIYESVLQDMITRMTPKIKTVMKYLDSIGVRYNRD